MFLRSMKLSARETRTLVRDVNEFVAYAPIIWTYLA